MLSEDQRVDGCRYIPQYINRNSSLNIIKYLLNVFLMAPTHKKSAVQNAAGAQANVSPVYPLFYFFFFFHLLFAVQSVHFFLRQILNEDSLQPNVLRQNL